MIFVWNILLFTDVTILFNGSMTLDHFSKSALYILVNILFSYVTIRLW